MDGRKQRIREKDHADDSRALVNKACQSSNGKNPQALFEILLWASAMKNCRCINQLKSFGH